MALIKKILQTPSIAYLHGDNALYAYKGGDLPRKNIMEL